MPHADGITFSFGENWQSFLKHVSKEAIEMALADTREWIPDVAGRSVIDVGCGSGLSSLAFHLRGAKPIVSFDVDPRSVAATRSIRARAGDPPDWQVLDGSALDAAFLTAFAERFDIVYSWGVLHHTGAMWSAIANVCRLVKPGGLLWIALYAKGPLYPRHLALKQAYNRAGRFGKWYIERKHIWWYMKQRMRSGRNPFTWNQRRVRGMDIWHDILDWLGGLPYEVATVPEVEAFMQERGFLTRKVLPSDEGGNHIFLFQRRDEGT